MPYFIISIGQSEVCCCQEENLALAKDDAVKLLEVPLDDLKIKEVSEKEAEDFATDWIEGEVCPGDNCPICNGPRSRQIMGAIILRECKHCSFRS